VNEQVDTVVSADGTPIAVWRSGTGPPLVLVHGATADHSRWAPALPALEEHFTVMAMDRRGRGRSGDADEYALERETEDVVAVVESAGEEVNLLGHSHGGVCAVEAARLTDALQKLILYEPPMGFLVAPAEVVQRLGELLDAGEREEMLTFFMRQVVGLPEEQVDLMRSLPAWQARLAAADTIPREELANREYAWEPDRFRDVHVPALYLQGGDSPEPFRLAGEALASALPDCRVVVMPGQSHTAIDTGTDLFTTEVLSFLRPSN
jgi:pimeloyl-ACP methyl ester carboxylesterase